MKLSYLIFSSTEQVSIALQAKNTSFHEALSAAEMTRSFLRRQREDGAFERFYSSVVLRAQRYTCEPVLPRYKRPPKHLDSGVSPHRFVTPQDYYRVQYFEVLDLVSEELTRRFDQASLALPKALEQLLIEASNHPDEMKLSVPEIVVEAYSRD